MRSSMILVSWLVASATMADKALANDPEGTPPVECSGTAGYAVGDGVLDYDVIVDCSAPPEVCVVATGSNDLNLADHTVSCDCPGSTACAGVIAVQPQSSGRVVQRGEIVGAFGIGVNGADRVLNVRINGAEIGINSEAMTKAVGNVITGARIGIRATLIANTTGIINNFIKVAPRSAGDPAPLVVVGIFVKSNTSGLGPHVDRNYIEGGHPAIYAETDSGLLRYDSNIIGQGTGPNPLTFVVPATHVGMTKNLCTDCEIPDVPFTLP